MQADLLADDQEADDERRATAVVRPQAVDDGWAGVDADTRSVARRHVWLRACSKSRWARTIHI
jgi:hypothetical protein